MCKKWSVLFFVCLFVLIIYFLLQDLDRQKRHLEEDNKLLRAEIQKLKADSRTRTRVIHEARRAHKPDVSHTFYVFLVFSFSSIPMLSLLSWGGPSFIFQTSFSALELRIFNSVFTLTGGLWAWGINRGEALICRAGVGPHFQPRCHSPGSAWPPHSEETLRPFLPPLSFTPWSPFLQNTSRISFQSGFAPIPQLFLSSL